MEACGLLPVEMLESGQWADVAEVLGEPGWIGRMAELGLRAGSRLQVFNLEALHASARRLPALPPRRPGDADSGQARGDDVPRSGEGLHLMASLDQLRVGQRARIEAVGGSPPWYSACWRWDARR